MNLNRLFIVLSLSSIVWAQSVEIVPVVSRAMERSQQITGEFLPFQEVALHARVQGFVDKVLVDRGSAVKQGQLLVKLIAPEMESQAAEAEAKIRTAQARHREAEASLESVQSTYDRLKAAAATPGAVAGNELILAEKAVESARGVMESRVSEATSAKAALEGIRRLQAYLNIEAPFPGVIVERLVHPGALAGPNTGPLLQLEELSRLRLVAAVPENLSSSVRPGLTVSFTVPALPGQTFNARVSRIARSLDAKTRTMSIELDVPNTRGVLAPGMYPELTWPVRSSSTALLVPQTSIVTTSERVFVIRVNNGRAQWLDVKQGARTDDLVQVFGDLSAGDIIVKRASDEVRDGTMLKIAHSGSK
jgi:membrane fusion protein, multidrug efflux system